MSEKGSEEFRAETEKKPEIELTPQQEEYMQEIIRWLYVDHPNPAIEIKEKVNLPEEIVNDPEVQEAAKQRMIEFLKGGALDLALKIKEEFNVPEKIAQAVAKQEVIKNLERHLPNPAIEIKEKFNLPEEIINDPEVQEAAKQRMIEFLKGGALDLALKIKEEFNVPEKIAQAVAKQEVIRWLNRDYPNPAFKIKEEFNLPEEIVNDPEVQEAAKQGMTRCWRKDLLNDAFKIKEEFNLPDRDFTERIKRVIEEGEIKKILKNLDILPERLLKPLEGEYFLLSYKADLNVPSEKFYKYYLNCKRSGEEINLRGFLEEIKEETKKLISPQAFSKKGPYYKELMEIVYPNNAAGWTNFEINEECLDRTSDLDRFKIRDVYLIDLKKEVEMVLKEGTSKDERAIRKIEEAIARIQARFNQLGFEKEKLLRMVNEDLEKLLENYPYQREGYNLEEKIFVLLLESLVGRFDPKRMKELLIAYQFAKFEDIQSYLQGIRERVEKTKNKDYAYLLELREFFADKIKDVQKKIVEEAGKNKQINDLFPQYYQEKVAFDQEKIFKEKLASLRIDQIGLEGNLLERILKVLAQETAKKGEGFFLLEKDEKGNLKLDEQGNLIFGKKSQALKAIIQGELNKAAKAYQLLTDQAIDAETIHLGELNLKECLQMKKQEKKGEFDERLFVRYLTQLFQTVFEEELNLIEKELNKYQPQKQIEGKKLKKLECYLSKNKPSAHARQVPGLCVAGDRKMWNSPNYFQMILKEPEKIDCKGLILLHYYEDKGKKILTAAFNPSSTYLYTVDERLLFKGLLDKLAEFAQDNEIDYIAVSTKPNIRTNRTRREFERALEEQIKKVNKKFTLSKPQNFSYSPEYLQQDLEIIWTRKKKK